MKKVRYSRDELIVTILKVGLWGVEVKVWTAANTTATTTNDRATEFAEPTANFVGRALQLHDSTTGCPTTANTHRSRFGFWEDGLLCWNNEAFSSEGSQIHIRRSCLIIDANVRTRLVEDLLLSSQVVLC